MNYDICMMVTDKSFIILELVIKKIRELLHCRAIVLIGRKGLKEKCEALGCDFIDEECVYESLSYNGLRNIILNRDVFAGNRTGWYLQQFLKCSYSFLCNDRYYLIWDSDLIPLKEISFFDE